MADNNNTQFKLDLDVADFLKNANHAFETINKLGDAENLAGLIGGLTKVTAAVAIVGATFFAFKKSMDLVFEVENIKATEQAFDKLSESVGISGEKIKQGLLNASNGLIDDNKILEASNKAIVQLGTSAAKLPEIMNVARAQTRVFGGDLLNNFEALNQAIASGQTRQLRHLGIVIDSESAYVKYAKSIGTTVSALSENEKKQAILNEVLEKGNKNLNTLGEETRSTQVIWQQFKIAMTSIGESIAIVFDKTIGPAVRGVLSLLKNGAQAIAGFLKTHLTEQKTALEQHNAEIEQVDKTSQNKRLQAETKLQLDLLKLKEQRISEEMRVSESIEEVNRLSGEKRLAILREEKEQEKLIRTQAALAELPEAVAAERIKELHANTAGRLKEIDDQLNSERIRALDNYENRSTSVADGISRGFEASSRKSAIEMQKFGHIGDRVFTSFSNHASNAFMELGEGAKSGADIMKGALFGMIAEVAEAQGRLMMGASLFPPNPALFAAGAALMVLAGFLKGQAKGGGSVGGGGGGEASGGLASGLSATGGISGESTQQFQDEKKKSVTIQIQGNYFETDQTRTRLMEMIREESDATDFKYVQIGQT